MKVEVVYFKPSGKFYTDETFEYSGEWFNVGDHVRKMNAESRLPGLNPGSWDGPIYLNSDEAYPMLILPAPQSKAGGLTHEEIDIACRNVGIDLSCGGCASNFYTGFNDIPHNVDCPVGIRRRSEVNLHGELIINPESVEGLVGRFATAPLVGWSGHTTSDRFPGEVPTAPTAEYPEYSRASGDCLCQVCHQRFRRHPYAQEYKDHDGNRWLVRLCDGSLVKL